MTRLTDGNKTIEVTLKVWDGNGYTPDWSEDFYGVGMLPYDEAANAYRVDNVDWCVDAAEDWRLCRGDFADDAESYDVLHGHERCVWVDDVTEVAGNE